MKKHTKIYFDFFNIEYDPVSGWHNAVSEISGLPAVDINHIECRGTGGSKTKDNIENLMALTREEHNEFGDKKQYVEYLKRVHSDFINWFAKNKFK
jgi:hypothetical protein